VWVGGTTIASRGGGFWARLLGGGWPEVEDVVQALVERGARRR
jgi:hypothetical protein